jgi:hypothetical protein
LRFLRFARSINPFRCRRRRTFLQSTDNVCINAITHVIVSIEIQQLLLLGLHVLCHGQKQTATSGLSPNKAALVVLLLALGYDKIIIKLTCKPYVRNHSSISYAKRRLRRL